MKSMTEPNLIPGVEVVWIPEFIEMMQVGLNRISGSARLWGL